MMVKLIITTFCQGFWFMAMEYWWDDDTHTIMRVTIGAGTTWDDYHHGVEAILYEMSFAPCRVYVIMEMMQNMPPGNPLPHLQRSIAQMVETPNLNGVMMVGSHKISGFAKTVLNHLLRLYLPHLPVTGIYFNSVDDARTAIAKLRG